MTRLNTLDTTPWRLLAGTMMLCGLILAFAPKALYAQAADLDHFKCYGLKVSVAPAPAPLPVTDVFIADQFGEEQVQIGSARQFCNPVEKQFLNNTSLVVDPDHHLTLYNFTPIASQPIFGKVKVSNQFGRQKFRFDRANLLAVPTHKVEGELLPPVGLSHFMCYFISGSLPDHVIAVGLTDQFESARHRVLEPFLFCNPASKTDAAGIVYPVENPDANLTCYTISPASDFLDKSIVIANQFTAPATQQLFPSRADMLCVPTRQDELTLGGGDDEDEDDGDGDDDHDGDDDDDDQGDDEDDGDGDDGDDDHGNGNGHDDG